MKNLVLVIGLAAVMVGCGRGSNTSSGARDRTRPGAIQSEPAGASPTEKVKPGVEFPNEYPSGANVQRNPNSNTTSGARRQQPPFGTARGNSGSYERTNNQER